MTVGLLNIRCHTVVWYCLVRNGRLEKNVKQQTASETGQGIAKSSMIGYVIYMHKLPGEPLGPV